MTLVDGIYVINTVSVYFTGRPSNNMWFDNEVSTLFVDDSWVCRLKMKFELIFKNKIWAFTLKMKSKLFFKMVSK